MLRSDLTETTKHTKRKPKTRGHEEKKETKRKRSFCGSTAESSYTILLDPAIKSQDDKKHEQNNIVKNSETKFAAIGVLVIGTFGF